MGNPSSLKEQIDAKFRQARLDKDDAVKNVIGLLKTKVQSELKSGKGVEEDDALWTKTVAAYAKQVRKSIAEYEKIGERGADLLAEAQFELGFCEQFLPKKLDAAATDALVKRLAGELGVTDRKMQGKLMGAIMKNHKDEVDGALVKASVDALFA